MQPTDDDLPGTSEPLDLDLVERELAEVERALERLDDGSYWTCEVTGRELPEELLASDPLARRAPIVP